MLLMRGEMGWILAGQTAAAVGNIAGVRIMTHVLPPDDYGRLALGMTVTGLFQQSLLYPFSNAVLRFFSAAREAGETSSFFRALRDISIFQSLAVGSVCGVCVAVLSWRGYSEWIMLVLWSGAFALVSNCSLMFDGMQNAARQRRIVAWHDGLGVWLRFLVGATAAVLLARSASSAMLGYAVASVVTLSSQYWFFQRVLAAERGRSVVAGIVNKWRSSILKFSWPFVLWGPFVWMQSASERWSLQIFADTTQVARYAVLFQLGYAPLMILGGLAHQLAGPIVFEIAGDGGDAGRRRRCHRIASALSLGTLAGTIVLALGAHVLGGELFELMLPAHYWEVAALLPWMVVAGGVFVAGQFAALSLISGREARPLLAPKIATGILAVALNLLGAKLFGLKGVVGASVLFSAAYYLWVLIAAQRHHRLPLAPAYGEPTSGGSLPKAAGGIEC